MTFRHREFTPEGLAADVRLIPIAVGNARTREPDLAYTAGKNFGASSGIDDGHPRIPVGSAAPHMSIPRAVVQQRAAGRSADDLALWSRASSQESRFSEAVTGEESAPTESASCECCREPLNRA